MEALYRPQERDPTQRCIMAPAQGSIFSFTAQWLQAMSCALVWHEWTIYVPYARCIPVLQTALRQLNAQAPLPHITPLVIPHPVSFEHRLGWMLGFLTPLVPSLSLEQRLDLAQEALAVWEQSIFFETPWEYLSQVEETRLTQHHSIAVDLLKHLAFDWPVFLQEHTDAYTNHDFIPKHHDKRPSLLMGSHGSLPTTRHLMRSLLNSAQGWIIFSPTPDFGPEARHPHHPLYGFSQTLDFLNIRYHDIVQGQPHIQGSQSTLHPQEAFLRGYVPFASRVALTQEIAVTVCATPMEEARHVADTALRFVKEGLSVLCVSPDPILAHSVVQRLRHENIAVLQHEALGLMHTASAQALCLLWRCAQSGWPFFPTLDFLKHSVWRYSWVREWACYLEDTYFRGQHLPSHIQYWLERHAQHTKYPNIAQRVLGVLKTYIAPLEQMMRRKTPYPLQDWTTMFTACAEDLWGAHLWESEQGILLKQTFTALSQAAQTYGALEAEAFYHVWCHLLQQQKDSKHTDSEAKIYLCGPREARLFAAEFEVCIMTSLYEGGWPRTPSANALIPASLQESLHFPPLPWQIGLSARDFFFCLGAKHIVGTRLASQGPKRISRFLLRLQRIAQDHVKEKGFNAAPNVYTVAKPCVHYASPMFTSLSVSDLVLLQSNSYAFYLKRILNLRPLEPLGFSRKNFGIECHRVLEAWVRRCPPQLHQSAEYLKAQMTLLVEEIIFVSCSNSVMRAQIWRCFQAFLAQESKLRAVYFRSTPEHQLRISVPMGEGSVTITTKIDRLDDLGSTYRIIDYKTGSIPKKITEDERSMQLWWMAWIVKHHPSTHRQHGDITVQFMHLSMNQGFQCVVADMIPDLDTLIQTQLDQVSRYVSGQEPYLALESPNFTDPISRRHEWK